MPLKSQPTLSSSNHSPYLLRISEEGYAFDTDFGVTYSIQFIDDADYLIGSSFSFPLFSFSITPVSGEVKQKDARIEQTIIHALLLTFDAMPDAVISYVCSLDDNQERTRSRLFHSWYLRIG